MSQLKTYSLRIDVDLSAGTKRIAFVVGQSEVSGHDMGVSLESTPRQLSTAELATTLQGFLAGQQRQLEGKLLEE